MASPTFYRVVLWLLAAVLLLALFACASGSNEGGGASADTTVASAAARKVEKPLRLILAASESRDSIAVITDFHVDQALRAALDTIPAAKYLTLNYRDSLAQVFVAEGKNGIPLPELGTRLDLDGAIYTRVARFGSMLATELRIVDPKNGNLLFRDLSFSFIRYRDSAGTLLLGPTLYDALRKSIWKYFGMPHTAAVPVATSPLIVAGVVIPRDPLLGQIAVQRQSIGTEGVKAIGELARLRIPELVAFDYHSRNEVYRSTINVAAIDDYVAMDALERQALYNVGIDRYAIAEVRLQGDSLLLGVELRYITSRTSDSLLDREDTLFPRTRFETSATEEELVVTLIDLAEPLFMREAERIRAGYERYRTRLAAEGKQ